MFKLITLIFVSCLLSSCILPTLVLGSAAFATGVVWGSGRK